MAGEINRVPAGLLSILDMKARGQNPRSLAEQVIGTVELGQQYLLQNRVWVSGNSAAVNAPGPFSTITVPSNEYWYINRVLARTGVNLAAATEYRVGVSLQRSNVAGAVIGTAITLDPTLFEVGMRPAVFTDRPFWASPGDALGVWCSWFAGTAVQFTVVVDHTPVPI